jgi:hypothetical protein
MNTVADTFLDVNTDTDQTVSEISATQAEQDAIDAYHAEQDDVVQLAIATLDPKDMLKKYAKLGSAVAKLAKRRKASVKAWNGAKDWAKVCTDLEDIVRMRVAIKEVKMDVYARVNLWLDAVRPVCPKVDKLSYYQVANKFLPTLQFDASELTGEIRKEWLTWVRLTVDKQLSDNPYSIKELDESIKERKAEIDDERKARDKRTPEAIIAAEQKAANKKLIAERSTAQSKIAQSIGDAFADKTADVNDVAKIFMDVTEQAGLAMPSRLIGFDPENCTVDDCKTLAKALLAHGKLAEMVALRDTLDVMVKIAQNAMITSKTG